MNPHSKAYSRTWRLVAPLPNGGGKFAYRLRVTAVLAALFAVSGTLIAWLLYFRPLPRAYFLPLCIGEYGEEFPVRGWVRQDGESLRSLGWKASNAFTSQQLALLQQELRQLAGRTFNGPLVVYLNAYARTTEEGDLCLLPVDANLDRPVGWLPLREVFRLLREAKARHTLLLLDIMQPFTYARHGLLINDAAERLQPLLEEALANDPKLSVLCACSPGQVSIVAEELGHSVFAYFLWKGLRGQADGENARRRKDDRVSFAELAAYVTAQVDQWTRQHRGGRQCPRLYGCTDDYPLIGVDASPAPEEEPPLPADYPDWLLAGWKRRDGWLEAENTRLELRAEVEAALLRLEQQWRGGLPAERARRELAAKRERLERRERQRHPAATSAPESLARATAGGRKIPKLADDKTIKAVAQLAVRYVRAKGSKPDAEALTKLKTDSDQLLKKLAGEPHALAWVVFAATDTDIPLPAALPFLAGLLEQAQALEYVETRLLARLAQLPSTPGDDRAAETILNALRTVREAEKYACGNPRSLPWFEEVQAGADRLRQQGELLLFANDPASRRRAAEPLRDALKSYQALNRDRDAVEEAQRWGEEMPVLLAGYLPYLEVDDATQSAWQNAVRTTGKLRQALAEPVGQPGTGRDAKIRRLIDLTAELRNDRDNLNRLRRPLLRQPFEELIGRRQAGDVADVKVMTALLETPWPRAEQRTKLWSARHELLGVLQTKRSETSGAAWNESRAIEAERRRGLSRAQRSLAVLQLLGSDKVENVEKALAHAAAMPADAGRLRAVAEALRQAWMRP